MKGYFECGKCSHQWTREGNTMDNRCPACGSMGGRCEIGTMDKPDWYQAIDKPSKPKSLFGRLISALERKS